MRRRCSLVLVVLTLAAGASVPSVGSAIPTQCQGTWSGSGPRFCDFAFVGFPITVWGNAQTSSGTARITVGAGAGASFVGTISATACDANSTEPDSTTDTPAVRKVVDTGTRSVSCTLRIGPRELEAVEGSHDYDFGGTVRVLVCSVSGAGSGSYGCRSGRPVPTPTVPSHNAFSSPRTIGSAPYQDRVDTRLATTQSGEPSPSCGSSARTVWYRFTAPATRPVVIVTHLSDYPVRIGVYRGSSLSSLQQVACGGVESSAGGGTVWQDGASFVAEANVTYRIQLGSARSTAGDLRLAVI